MGETTQNGSFFAEQVKMQDSYDWAARLRPEPGERLGEKVNPTIESINILKSKEQSFEHVN